MTLEQLLNRFDGVERSIVIVNRTEPDPVLNMLIDTFGDSAVDVIDSELESADGDLQGVVQNCEQEATEDHPCDGGLSAQEFTTTRTSRGDRRAEGPLIDVDALRQNDAIPFDSDDPETIENLALLVEGDTVVAGSTLE